MRIAYEAENIIDANLVKNALEDAGIPAFVSGHYLTGAAGELPPFGLVNVMVADAQWPQARAIAECIDAALAENRANAETDGHWAADPI